MNLKQIVGYLPFEVMLKDIRKKIEFKLHCKNANELVRFNKQIKPMLNPFTIQGLQKEFIHQGLDDNMANIIYSSSWMAGGYSIRADNSAGNRIFTIESQEDNSSIDIYLDKPQVNMGWVNELLYEYHFDLHNFIESGDALEK